MSKEQVGRAILAASTGAASPEEQRLLASELLRTLSAVSLVDAQSILDEMTNGVIDGVSTGKNGRAWLSGEFQLCELEAICVLVRHTAGENAEGAAELIAQWKAERNDDEA